MPKNEAVSAAPSDVSILESVNAEVRRGLAALSAPDSLTDALALDLLVSINVEDAQKFLSMVHACDFVVHRLNEWRLTIPARNYLRSQLQGRNELHERLHLHLTALTAPQSEWGNSEVLPHYLLEGPGRAYHTSELNPDEGLKLYAELGHVDEPRINWLGARLAAEQQERGVLPEDAAQLRFLRAMWLYRDGRTAEAIELLRPSAESKAETKEAAVATHLVGRFDVIRGQGKGSAGGIKMLRRSLRLARVLGLETHEAHVAHSLALAILTREPWQRAAAFELLDRSLELCVKHDDLFGQAKVLHTWGQGLEQSPSVAERKRGQAFLRESLELGVELGEVKHQTEVLRSLLRVVRRGREHDLLEDRLMKLTGGEAAPRNGVRGRGPRRERRARG